MNLSEDIRSLTEFKRNTAELVEQLKSTGRPLVLTVNGKAEIVVQDAATYQELLDRVEAIDGLARGLEESERGKATSVRQALTDTRKKRRRSKK